MLNKKLFRKIQKYINSVDVVSFDIFDTLLIRPYVKPTDLFLHMEKHFDEPFFASCRIAAEQSAREKNPEREDITFDAIYDEIDDKFKYLKSRELEWEENVLQPYPEIQEIWNFVKQSGKKIVVASDMYLPTDFIAKILQKNGFGDYDKLYVSGDVNMTKCRGTMFDAIICDMGVKPKKILHIGDNSHSDYEMPKTLKIKCFLIEKYIDIYLKKNIKAKKFLEKQSNQIGASILVSLLAINAAKNEKNNYWTNLGYEYAGPIAYSYVKWINNIADEKNIDDLLFVARDGYVLEQVHKQISDRSSHYVYAPRYLGLICQLSYRTDDSDVAKAQQRTIIQHYAKTNKQFEKIVKNTDFSKISQLEFLQTNKTLLESLARDNFRNYKKYIDELHTKNHIGIVDSITENFTAQKLLTSALGSKKHTYGFYFVTIHKNKIIQDSLWSSFVNSSNFSHPEWINHWALMEFLLTSPEYPIEGIDVSGKPIYKKDIDKYEQKIRSLYPYISSAAVSFVQDMRSIFDDVDIYLDYDVIVSWINCFVQYPTKTDIKNMFSIKTATNPNNDSYENLFGQYISPLYVLLHPKKSIRIAKTNLWRTTLQQISINYASPIKISTNRGKKFYLIFFPKLKKEYACIKVLNIKISLGENK